MNASEIIEEMKFVELTDELLLYKRDEGIQYFTGMNVEPSENGDKITIELTVNIELRKERRAKMPYPFYVSKTVNVSVVPPYNLVVEFETGEKRMLDIEEWIDKDPNLHILKEDPDLFRSPSVSLWGYETAWEGKGIYREFHNDIVYMYGDDVVCQED